MTGAKDSTRAFIGCLSLFPFLALQWTSTGSSFMLSYCEKSLFVTQELTSILQFMVACQTRLIEMQRNCRMWRCRVCVRCGGPPSQGQTHPAEWNVRTEERELGGSGSCVQAVVLSVWWLPGCSEGAAGLGGERQVNYCTEREGWGTLQRSLWDVRLGFQHITRRATVCRLK